ncbi:hypothetical protein Tco_1198776 [Tanacetum coccineum]
MFKGFDDTPLRPSDHSVSPSGYGVNVRNRGCRLRLGREVVLGGLVGREVGWSGSSGLVIEGNKSGGIGPKRRHGSRGHGGIGSGGRYVVVVGPLVVKGGVSNVWPILVVFVTCGGEKVKKISCHMKSLDPK